MLYPKVLAVSKDGSVLLYEYKDQAVAAEVGAEKTRGQPRRVYFSGADASPQQLVDVSLAILNDLPRGAIGARITENGLQFLRL